MNNIEKLRAWMDKGGFGAFVVPSADPHGSEYVARHYACREWLTGFTGSAGVAVVTARDGALWTDSRYFLQAEGELADDFTLQRSGIDGTPTIEEWLVANLAPTEKVAIDGRLFTKAHYDAMVEQLAPVELVLGGDPFADIWSDRPSIPTAGALLLGDEYTGESRVSKIARLRRSDATQIVSVLDDTAWLLNLRGGDIECNPLLMSYLAVEPNRTILFADIAKFSREQLSQLSGDGVEVRPYGDWFDYLRNLEGEIIANAARIDVESWNCCRRITPETITAGAINCAKAIKNEVELSGFRRAMVADGVALVRAMMWVEANPRATECDIAAKLRECRAADKNFRGESFSSIVAYGANAAMAHYHPTVANCAAVGDDNFLLIDSGGQYLDGTTDITRTYHRTTPTDRQRADYTNVLRGFIDISSITFPVGTRGAQLDALARQYIWRAGMNYLHGTGHGVGHFLCVHEGPQSIRTQENPVALKPGMVMSVEPSLYRRGEWGIRIENLVAVVESQHDGFLRFETLSLSPIDTAAIDWSAMDRRHVEWLENYHATVQERLAPHLLPHENLWLTSKLRF